MKTCKCKLGKGGYLPRVPPKEVREGFSKGMEIQYGEEERERRGFRKEDIYFSCLLVVCKANSWHELNYLI